MKFILVFMVVVIALFVAPSIVLWSINTLSEQAGQVLYIPHNVWTYLSVLGLYLALFWRR
jgi:hypothetical protein